MSVPPIHIQLTRGSTLKRISTEAFSSRPRKEAYSSLPRPGTTSTSENCMVPNLSYMRRCGVSSPSSVSPS